MNEPETFIVTVQTEDGGFVQDMELPSEMSASELSKKLLEALKSIPESGFDSWKTCRFECDNQILEDSDTLLKAGVFDGSLITLLEE